MRIVAINGSGRKGWNTETILKHVLKGAQGAAPKIEVEMAQLFPMRYSGCCGCHACKRKGSLPGKCHISDELTPILEMANTADVLVIGSPIYFFGENGGTRSFFERFIYPWMDYSQESLGTKSAKSKAVAMVYTMNVNQAILEHHGWQNLHEPFQFFFAIVFGNCDTLWVPNTQQVADYSKYEFGFFDANDKYRSRKEDFTKDCAKAEKFGADLVAKAKRLGLGG